MTLSTAHVYEDRSIFDVNTLIGVLRFTIINAILAVIFLFIALEEIDWALLSFREKMNDQVIDNTSWNIKTIF